MWYNFIICLLLLSSWLVLLYGGWAIAQGGLKAYQWLVGFKKKTRQRKRALSGGNQIKRKVKSSHKNSPSLYTKLEGKASGKCNGAYGEKPIAL